jgi:hypothetical protein
LHSSEYLGIKNAPPKFELYLSNFRGALHSLARLFFPRILLSRFVSPITQLSTNCMHP